MNLDNFPQKYLPKELIDIPLGQIYILTNPNTGITSQDIFMMQFIFSMSRDFKQEHIINTIPVDNSELWGCCICKVQTGQVIQILISDKSSIVEMLCEFWDLDYKEVRKNYTIKKRYQDVKITMGGFPFRISVISSGKTESMTKTGDYTFTLQYLPRNSKDELLGKIRDILQDNFNQNVGISSVDILQVFEEERSRERKTWHLDIQIKNGKKGYNANYEWVQKMSCEISLIAPDGTKYPLKLEAQQIALYLSFILFREGIKLVDLGREDFYTIYKTICERIPSINNIPDEKTLVKNSSGKRNKIKSAIKDIIKEPKYIINQFAIEGYEGEEYKVAAATDDHRELIKKSFSIE